jgi:hypothetical protein
MMQAPATRPDHPLAAASDSEGGDLFALGRRAAAAARAASGGRGVFSRCRQLLASGAWKGPRDAALPYVEEEDAAALGGPAAAREAGARLFLARSGAAAQAAADAGLTLYLRLLYRAGEPEAVRRGQRAELQALLRAGLPLSGVIPTPQGEPMGLDTVQLVALCRLELQLPHVVADFDRLGHRLAQMSLGFGADELFGPILPERSLRLGANAHNTVMTRKEAATLLRGAGLVPCERLSDGRLEEVPE